MCKLALESLPFRMFQSKMLPILRVDFETTLNFENYTYNARLVDQVVTPYVSSGEEKILRLQIQIEPRIFEGSQHLGGASRNLCYHFERRDSAVSKPRG